MLSDEERKKLVADEMEWYSVGEYAYYTEAKERLEAFARAIESAATAPLLARIAELEQQLAEARRAAERRLDLVERVRKYPENIDHKGSLLWGDILREVERAAIKEQT